MTRFLGDHFFDIATGMVGFFFGLFGLLCIIRPKFGNLSRAMGVVFVGSGLLYAAGEFRLWRVFAFSLGVLIAGGLVWCSVECFKFHKRRLLSKVVGTSLTILAVGLEYFSWQLWYHIPMRSR